MYFATYYDGAFTRQDVVHDDYLYQRCSIPAGLFEEVYLAWDELGSHSLLVEQCAGYLIQKAAASNSRFQLPVATQTYARVRLAAIDIELKLDLEGHTISATIHAQNAAGFVCQVRCMMMEERFSSTYPRSLLCSCATYLRRQLIGITKD